VRDNGAGIQEQDKPHLFEPFFTTKALGKGLGLGLSISYRLAKDMQGELSAENAADGGAIFSLLLPIATNPRENQDD
jgi:two-component system C4-dicarboxylate transport sensor histidine kinase DctB